MKRRFLNKTFFYLSILGISLLAWGCARKPLPWSRELDSKALKVYNEGQDLFNGGRYWAARGRYNKVIKEFSRSRYADNAQFMLGEIQAVKRNYEAAVEAYHKTAQNYPASELLPKIAEKEYDIAVYYWTKNKKKLAVEIFAKVVEDYPYGDLAPKAQYRVADYYFSEKKDYEQAIIQYARIIDDYPKLPCYTEAVYRLGVSYWKESLMWALDQKNTDMAVEQFNRVISEFPTSAYVSSAKELRAAAIEKKAYKEYKTGYFYYWEGDYAAARLYYGSVLNNYPNSSSVADSLFDIGRTYYKEKQWLMAQEYFTKVKATYSQNAKLMVNVNQMLEKCAAKLAKTQSR